MSKKIDEIIGKIRELEGELKSEIDKKEQELSYTIERHRVRFEEAVLEKHKKEVEHVFKYVFTAPKLNLLTAPVIYSLIFPAMLLDFFVSLYQAVCFPVYTIDKVKRSDYIVVDRHYLHYLNSIQKLNCIYCGYMNGLFAYISEVAARTEQYWCPIKHANKSKGFHAHYRHFFDYGDATAYKQELKRVRRLLKNQDKNSPN